MRKSKLAINLMACAALSACATPKMDMETNMIETETLINKSEFVHQSTLRSKREVGFGPQVDKSKDATLRQDARKHINTEEAPNYDELSATTDAENVFNISMNVENVDIRTFSDLLSEITGMNFMVSDEVNQLITAKVEDVPWPSMLDSILKMKTLAKHVDKEANIVRIHDYSTVSQIEDFERKRKENMQKALLLKQASEPLHTELFKLYYTDPEHVKEMLEGVVESKKKGGAGALAGLRDTRPEFTVDKRKNMIIVKARQDDMDVISKVIEQVDSRTEQVYIEAFIVEVSDGFEHALGVRLGARASDTGTKDGKPFSIAAGGLAGTTNDNGDVALGDNNASGVNLPVANPFGGIGLLAGIGSSAELKIELTAMEAAGLSKVISNPKIFTLDNQEAIIFQGTEVPFETTSQDGTNVQFKEAGLRLAVKPTVVGDGNLMMQIVVNKDSVDTSQENPPISKSEIRTSLVSRDGAVVVIGGIYDEQKSQSADKVPGLGDVPGAGKLFRRDQTENNKRELLVFIAPRII